MEISKIATIYTDFDEKFGIPRQSGIATSAQGRIVMDPEFAREEFFREIEGWSHLWLLWGFSENDGKWQPTVRPPRLGGNKRVGVFASRSGFRPNGLGLSAVKLESVDLNAPEGIVLCVSGVDMLSGTPIYDIKPYHPQADCIEGAKGGFTDSNEWQPLKVAAPEELLNCLPKDKAEALLEILSQDPRPRYQDDPERTYGFGFAGKEIRFKVCDDTLILTDIIEN